MTESLADQIRRVLQDAPFAMRQLAADAGLSYDVLRSWRSGRRRPSRSSALRLATGLQQRGELLLRLAGELRETAEAGPVGAARSPERDGQDSADQAHSYAAERPAGGGGHGDSGRREPEGGGAGEDAPVEPGRPGGPGGPTWRETTGGEGRGRG
jgi:transcriptional regulator with XRE-family HTH domain